jgi:hypothetical protein
MYTANPPTPTPGVATWPRQATLCPPWWTIPEAYRLQMHAFTRPSHQLRQKARAATLRNLHHTSIYRRLIFQAKEQGATTATTGTAIHTRLRENSKEGTYLLKFIHGQLYNGKLAKRYGHAPTDECPLCHRPDSCTHIARECKFHKNLTISRHNAACQLIHAAIRNSAKGGGELYGADDLRLVAADADNQNQTTEEELSTIMTPILEANQPTEGTTHTLIDRLEPLLPEVETRLRRHTDVSQDPRYDRATTAGDSECTEDPTRIPEWILPHETQERGPI